MSTSYAVSNLSPDQLAIANIKLAHYISRKFRFWAEAHGIDENDVESAAMLALVVACRHYDPARGVAIAALLGRAITHAILGLRRTKAARWRHTQLPTDAQGIELDPADPHGDTPDADAEMDDERLMVRHMLDKLPPRHRRAVEGYYLQDLSLREISQELRVSVERARQLVKSGLAKLRGDAGQVAIGATAAD